MTSQQPRYVTPWILFLGLGGPALLLLLIAQTIELDDAATTGCLIAYFAFTIPLFLAGMLSGNTSRSPSFSLARPGLKEGYRVKPRLQFVDFCTLIVRIIVVVVAVGICVWSMQFWIHYFDGLRFREWLFLLFTGVLLILILWIVDGMLIAVLSIVLRSLRLMTSNEARHFPLNYPRRASALNAWPDEWQEPIER